MTATITELRPAPATRMLAVPLLPRERRRELLETLAARAVTGIEPAEDEEVAVLAAAWGSPELTAGEAAGKWQDVKDEYDRWQAVQAGDPLWRDLQPGLADCDLRAALNDLLDGTDTYHGDRRGGAGASKQSGGTE